MNALVLLAMRNRSPAVASRPVAVSATHVAYSSIRVEPAWMTIGHSAGVAAALAVAGDRDVQDLDYPALRARLVAQRQVLDFPANYKPPTAGPALEGKP